ncbi:hypothetical protein [Nonomuraea sp. NPDC049725]|uniref:hypothetical protein n=1 Tax=Nonomuraea sp. NPDC049725 TaxID=3154508 RepID=UPI00341250D1
MEAATLPLNGLIAAQALDGLGLDDGQTLLVTGAAGAVGGFAVQLAVARGLRVVAVAGAADEPLVRRLGADLFVPARPKRAPSPSASPAPSPSTRWPPPTTASPPLPSAAASSSLRSRTITHGMRPGRGTVRRAIQRPVDTLLASGRAPGAGGRLG